MSCDFEKFLNWAEDRFGEVVVRGDEIKVNSIFCEDFKHHLWCNPYGGKKGRENGVFRCWKTDQRGSLVTLVMMVDKCSYEEALEVISGEAATLAELEKQVEEMFSKKTKPPELPVAAPEPGLSLPPYTYLISDLPSSSFYRSKAETYLNNRKIPIDNLYVCSDGDYRNRIIIPYFNQDRKLIYFNGRYIGESKTKYLFPNKNECGLEKGNLIYFPKWPAKGERLYLTEGEFDAITLNLCGLISGACGGKSLTPEQIEILRNYQITLALDNDAAGKSIYTAQFGLADILCENSLKNINYVLPPPGFKDWNEVLKKHSRAVLRSYILGNEKKYEWLSGHAI